MNDRKVVVERGHGGVELADAAVDEILTGRENLEMVGRLYRLPPREARQRAGDILERFDLADGSGLHLPVLDSTRGLINSELLNDFSIRSFSQRPIFIM